VENKRINDAFHHSHPSHTITVIRLLCNTIMNSQLRSNMSMFDSGDGGGRITVTGEHPLQTILTSSTYSLMSFYVIRNSQMHRCRPRRGIIIKRKSRSQMGFENDFLTFFKNQYSS
jgi:hypothetical protein